MNTSVVNAERVLQLLRRLPPHERLRADVLPGVSAESDFWAAPDSHTLMAQQEVLPVTDFEALLGGWPEDEPLEPFLAALQTWREQNPALVDGE